MDIKQAAQEIRDRVSMEEILDLYGYKTRRGSMCCPFHGEKNPSLKVYPRTGGWHCFGCNRGGSVIDFVMEHENCSFPAAVRAIDGSLRLGLLDPTEDPMEARKERQKQEYLDNFVEAVNAYLDLLDMQIERERKTRFDMVRILECKRRDDRENGLTADEWTELLKCTDDDQFDEYRQDRIEAFREEVAAWRRKARRATSA